jgi:hypothetical protein
MDGNVALKIISQLEGFQSLKVSRQRSKEKWAASLFQCRRRSPHPILYSQRNWRRKEATRRIPSTTFASSSAVAKATRPKVDCAANKSSRCHMDIVAEKMSWTAVSQTARNLVSRTQRQQHSEHVELKGAYYFSKTRSRSSSYTVSRQR